MRIENPFKGIEGERLCRCNQCGKTFNEGDIICEEDEEYCPECGEDGCIADICELQDTDTVERHKQTEECK